MNKSNQVKVTRQIYEQLRWVRRCIVKVKEKRSIANRIVLNEASYHGVGAIQEIASKAKARGFRKAFVCSDPNLIEFNVTCRVTKVLEDAGLAYEIYSGIRPNPIIENVQTGVAVFKASGADHTIAIGDGSSMNISKATGVIIINPEFEDVRSLEGATPTRNPCVPIVVVPTMADTTAEVTINYAITDVEEERKLVCMNTYGIPAVTVVDPGMMSSMPKGLIAATGMDALTRTAEGYTTEGAWEMTDMFNLKATEVITRSLRDAVENKSEGKEGMALNQYLTGMGPFNCDLGIIHSMARGLGALYDTPHGVANAIILPTAMGHNAPCTGTKFKDITAAMGMKDVENITQEEYHKATVDAVEELFADVGIPADLKEIVKPEDVDFLSQSTMDDAYRPGNSRDPSLEDIKNLYLSLM